MEFETYADVIDAFERDNMGYDSLTDYIKGENIKIAEIDMDPMGDFAKIFNKKDGGMMIAIEQLGQGGITGGKTYHQYHDSFVPRDEESMGYANGGGVGSMMQPKKKIPQLVKPNKDGSRPGYRGPGGYQGGATNQGGAGKGSSGSSGSSGNTGGGGGGGSTNREKGIMSRYTGPKGTTGNIRNFKDTGPDRSAVGQFSTYGQNVMNQNLTKNNPSRRGGIGGFLSGIIPTLLGFVNPFVGMAAKGIMGIPKGLINFNNKIQNSDFGKSTSLADYLDIRSYGGFDEREEARKNTMDSAKDLQSRIDAGEFGGPNLNTNTAPKTNVNIQGTNLNDFQIGDPGKYATADMINEFGVKAGTADDIGFIGMPGTADDRFANKYEDPFGNPLNDPRVVSEEYGLVGNEVPQGIRFNNPVGGVDQFAKEMEALEANLPMGVNAIMTPEMMGGTLQDFYTNKNLTGASTGGFPSNAKSLFEVFNDNVNFNDQASLPGNNLINNEINSPEFQLAKVTKEDLAKYTPRNQKNLIDIQDYNSALDTGTINPNMTEFEFNKMKEGLITQPGTYTEEDFA